MQIVFQDPYSSLNPRMTVGKIISEPLRVHTDLKKDKLNDRLIELVNLVGLQPEHIDRYPHEFSGGQRQRIGIARAIALNRNSLSWTSRIRPGCFNTGTDTEPAQ